MNGFRVQLCFNKKNSFRYSRVRNQKLGSIFMKNEHTKFLTISWFINVDLAVGYIIRMKVLVVWVAIRCFIRWVPYCCQWLSVPLFHFHQRPQLNKQPQIIILVFAIDIFCLIQPHLFSYLPLILNIA